MHTYSWYRHGNWASAMFPEPSAAQLWREAFTLAAALYFRDSVRARQTKRAHHSVKSYANITNNLIVFFPSATLIDRRLRSTPVRLLYALFQSRALFINLPFLLFWLNNTFFSRPLSLSVGPYLAGHNATGFMFIAGFSGGAQHRIWSRLCFNAPMLAAERLFRFA